MNELQQRSGGTMSSLFTGRLTALALAAGLGVVSTSFHASASEGGKAETRGGAGAGICLWRDQMLSKIAKTGETVAGVTLASFDGPAINNASTVALVGS